MSKVHPWPMIDDLTVGILPYNHHVQPYVRRTKMETNDEHAERILREAVNTFDPPKETKEQKRCSDFNKGTPVRRKWGYYVDHLREDTLVIKTLVIEPNQAISYQRHFNRDEAWVVAQGFANVTTQDETTRLIPGESFFVENGDWHTVHNLSSEEDLIIVEVQLAAKIETGKCDEDDIERM